MKVTGFLLLLAIFLVAFAANVNSKAITSDSKQILSDIHLGDDVAENSVSDSANLDVLQESVLSDNPEFENEENEESVNDAPEDQPADEASPHDNDPQDNDPESALKPEDEEESHHQSIHPSIGTHHAHDIKIKHIQRYFRHLFKELGKLVASVIEDVSKGEALGKNLPTEGLPLRGMYPENKFELKPKSDE